MKNYTNQIKSSIALIGYLLILVYFYFSLFSKTMAGFWTYTYTPPNQEKKVFRKIKVLYNTSSNGVKAFVFPGSLVKYFFHQSNTNDWIFKAYLPNYKSNKNSKK